VSFSYCGWNAAVYVGGEVAQPDLNLPRSLMFGTLIVTVLYLGLNTVFVFSAPLDALAGKVEVGRIAAEALGGPALAELITAVVALALATSVSSLVMAGPRVYAQMASDGYLPHWLEAKSGPPRLAIALQCLAALALLWTATYEGLLTYIGFTLGLSTAATVAGLMRLRMREGPSLKVPGWPWVQALFIAAVLAITAFSILRRPGESLAGLATIAIGWLAWFRLRDRARANPKEC
jgi:APA family basic amino acid/polyamine antiporter